MPKSKHRRFQENKRCHESTPSAAGPSRRSTLVSADKGVPVQFFLDGDLTDVSIPFVARQSAGMSLQLRQSHGWLDGTLAAESCPSKGSSTRPSPERDANKTKFAVVWLNHTVHVLGARCGESRSPVLSPAKEPRRETGPAAMGHPPWRMGKQHGLYVVDVRDGEHRPVSTRSALDR